MNRPVRIGMVAGEISGDHLGADLIPHLRAQFPGAEFAGLGGERMLAEGFLSLDTMDRLSVMGFVDPLKRLPELLRIRKNLYRYFVDHQFDLVLGIDAPDFNLGLELKLRKKGVLTAHYVSPSVWAWRQGRIKKIARAVDLMLTLLPFEAEFYRAHNVPVAFVGHPLADQIPMSVNVAQARQALGLSSGVVLAIMPGSRRGEVEKMARLYLEVAVGLVRENEDLQIVIPAASPARFDELSLILKEFPGLNVHLLQGNSHQAMACADAVLLTSGTTALEAMLLKKPMVVAYRMGRASYWLLSKLVKTPYISLPNLIAGEMLVPELVQTEATVDNLMRETSELLFNQSRRESVVAAFGRLHGELQKDASRNGAEALAELIRSRRAG